MSRDFDRPPRKSTPKRRRHPAAFGVFVDDEPERPSRFTTMSILARLVAMLVSYFILAFVLGGNLLTLLLSIVAGLVLYEAWYLAFESSV